MELQFARKTKYDSSIARNNIEINLDWPERYASVLSGISLFAAGVKSLMDNPFSNLIKSAAGGYLLYRGLTGHCPLYSSLGKHNTTPLNINIRHTFTVDRPRMEVYRFWKQLDNLPLFMKHLGNVTILSPKRSHWEVKLPARVGNISWDAEIVEDQEGHMIGWQSVPGAMVYNAGKVEFKDAPDGNGTLLNVVISYTPPAGGVGNAVGRLLNPLFENMVRQDVLNLKDYLEASGTLPNVSVHHSSADTNASLLM